MPPIHKMASAIGRSNCDPSFGSSAGAKLTINLPFGKSRDEFFIALRTLSRDSSIALLPIPTICRLGSPFDMSPSTSIIFPVKP